MQGILLLNASYEPLRIVSLARGMGLVFTDKAEVVEESDEPLRSQHVTMKAPSVIRLLRFVKVPYRAQLPLTRKNLIARDFGKCAYCKKQADFNSHTKHGMTIDHVFPRARGGKHEWENVVLACRRCNQAKKDKTLEELGWHLDFAPRPPKGLVWFTVGLSVRPEWQPYLSIT